MSYRNTLSADGQMIDGSLRALTPAQRKTAEERIDAARVEFLAKANAAVYDAKHSTPELEKQP